MGDDTHTADALIRDLAEAGTRDSDGTFTLSPEATRDQAQEFALPDPLAALPMLVRAGIARGAPEVRIRRGPARLDLTFEGEPLTREQLEQVHVPLLSRREDGAGAGRFELAVALVTLEHRAGAEVRVRGGGATLRLQTDGTVTVRRRFNTKTRTEIRIRVPEDATLSNRLTLRHPDQQRWLAERLQYAEQPILVDGTRVSRGFDEPDLVDNESGSD